MISNPIQTDTSNRLTPETIMLEVLRERDELIAELNKQLHSQEVKITQLVDSIEKQGFSSITEIKMEDAVKSGFVWETQGRHLMMVEVTTLIKDKSPYLHLDQRVKIVKEEISSDNIKRTEELHHNYAQLLQEFSTLQSVLQQKDSEAESIVQSLKDQIVQSAAHELQKERQKEKDRAAALNETETQQIERLLEQNELLRMELQQSKKQISSTIRHPSQKIQTNAENEAHHLKNQQILKKTEEMIFELENLRMKNENLEQMVRYLKHQKDKLNDEVMQLRYERNSLPQVDGIKFAVDSSLRPKKLDSDHEDALLITLHDYSVQSPERSPDKHPSIEMTAEKLNPDVHPQLDQVAFVSNTDVQQISALSFPEAQTAKKQQSPNVVQTPRFQQKQKPKPKRYYRVGY